jgi:hypothetical protein
MFKNITCLMQVRILAFAVVVDYGGDKEKKKKKKEAWRRKQR